jgi:hypothetical protein
MKTVFCDIDGTLLNHTGDIIKNNLEQSVVLPAVTDVLKQWDRASYTLVLTTGRKESLRSHTENQLRESGIFYDQLIMGLPNGDRIVINDRKSNSPRNTAYAINLVRNSGLGNIDFTSKNINFRNSLNLLKNKL